MELSAPPRPSGETLQNDRQWKNAIEAALLEEAKDLDDLSSSADLSETSTMRLSPPVRSDSDADDGSTMAVAPHRVCRHPRWHEFLTKGPGARAAARRRWPRAAVLPEFAISHKVRDKSVDLWPFLAGWRGWCALVARWQVVELFRPFLRGAPSNEVRSYGCVVLLRQGPSGTQERLVVRPAPSAVLENFTEWSGLQQLRCIREPSAHLP